VKLRSHWLFFDL